MNDNNLIGTRHLQVRGRKVPVTLFRNAGGSVAGRFHFGESDTPILDGPDEAAVLELMHDVVESLLLLRKSA